MNISDNVALRRELKASEALFGKAQAKYLLEEKKTRQLERKLKIARELIGEVHSQCPDENDWLQKADDWLEDDQ
jgi:hypothetical protein